MVPNKLQMPSHASQSRARAAAPIYAQVKLRLWQNHEQPQRRLSPLVLRLRLAAMATNTACSLYNMQHVLIRVDIIPSSWSELHIAVRRLPVEISDLKVSFRLSEVHRMPRSRICFVTVPVRLADRC